MCREHRQKEIVVGKELTQGQSHFVQESSGHKLDSCKCAAWE